jgi:hypothetical protein
MHSPYTWAGTRSAKGHWPGIVSGVISYGLLLAVVVAALYFIWRY